MDKGSVTLKIFFEEPFWIGVFERVSYGELTVCKVIFGSEPKDYDIYMFILKKYHQLHFSPAVEYVVKENKINPKRLQRNVRKQLQDVGFSKKSWEALKLQQEQIQMEKKQVLRLKQKRKKQIQFELKQQKKKNKHRGR